MQFGHAKPSWKVQEEEDWCWIDSLLMKNTNIPISTETNVQLNWDWIQGLASAVSR